MEMSTMSRTKDLKHEPGASAAECGCAGCRDCVEAFNPAPSATGPKKGDRVTYWPGFRGEAFPGRPGTVISDGVVKFCGTDCVRIETMECGTDYIALTHIEPTL